MPGRPTGPQVVLQRVSTQSAARKMATDTEAEGTNGEQTERGETTRMTAERSLPGASADIAEPEDTYYGDSLSP
jgi:hypothetical protein